MPSEGGRDHVGPVLGPGVPNDGGPGSVGPAFRPGAVTAARPSLSLAIREPRPTFATRSAAKAQAYLRAHLDHIAIQRLRMNKPLTSTDLSELERMLAESGVGAREDIERARAESQGLGLFVRSMVGRDREAAKQALAGFLSGRRSQPTRSSS